ncbi:MFS transporter [Paenibacillus baekrokdamisoli]|uniref:MFS transporter n=1 Tax=Paenibacillus baekrokdamisoli TaxID=1712516 RepID=A0A3G9IT12_9BACL|nr:MDR family MFS transporter [Paenibacillus baekrokdamisoli]MBB3072934.1 EmrB/QacA subfamily drug resistance transporter [Paenibacillus baekrokdamisoli]BBH22010.1 MFS transporter [Paenibacillus baekrokdamisoli]
MDANRSNVKLVIAGLLLGLFMAALDQTIVSTAMTKIIQQLGGLDKFVWVYSAYMIAMVVSTPIFGKLSDMYGRKRFFLAGLILFMLGSILCGTAQNMEQLIIYRAIQGIGGGALMPIVFTIIFDLFPAEKRGKMMGLFGAVFGVSSVFGPIMGGLITDNISWRWIFYINVPIGILSVFFIAKAYHESKNTRKQSIDWAGAILLTAAILCLMFGLELGGSDGWAWGSVKTISLFVASGALLIIFLLVERAVKDPIIQLSLFKKRLFTSSMMISLLYGGVMISAATYIPIFIQGVFHKTATETSSVLTPMMLGVVLSSQVGGRIANKFRFRDVMIVSALTLLIGITLLGFAMDTTTSRLIITLYMVIVGLGMGVSFSLLNISTLNSVPPQYKGSASSLITFFRTIGSALGVTVFGALQKSEFQAGVKEISAITPAMAAKIKGGQALLDPTVQAKMGMSPDIVNSLLSKLADSIIYIFQWSVLLPVLAIVFAILMGRARYEVAKQGSHGAPDKQGPQAEGTSKPKPSYRGG